MAVDLGIDAGDSGIILEVRNSGDGLLHATIAGSAELPAVELMGTFVERLHARACELSTQEVIVDLGQLEFMNSSCFKSLVTWLNYVNELEPSQRYKIRFRSNPLILWQRRSLHVLQTMASDVISVES